MLLQIAIGLIIVIAIFAIKGILFPAAPTEDSFQCAGCRSTSPHTERTLRAWRNDKKRFFCPNCNQQFKNKNLVKKEARLAAFSVGEGSVIKILPDDNEGDRHQKFILKLHGGDTILIAHNIDIAPRIPDLKLGDSVSFSGILERNERGGVLHWTHKDPDKTHADGWLKHQEKIYQ